MLPQPDVQHKFAVSGSERLLDEIVGSGTLLDLLGAAGLQKSNNFHFLGQRSVTHLPGIIQFAVQGTEAVDHLCAAVPRSVLMMKGNC